MPRYLRSKKTGAISLLLCLLITGCSSQFTKNYINQQTIYLEHATTPPRITQGLMYRDELPANHGMLFIFDTEEHRSFWMKNTLIPLDIIFLDKNQLIGNIIYNATPCKEIDPTQTNCPTYQSTYKAQYVIELNAGKATELNLEPNQKLNLSSLQSLE